MSALNLVNPPMRKRQRLQFRLRSALLLVALLGVPLAWLGREMELVRREQAADQAAAKLRQAILDEIESLGGHEWAGDYYYGDGLGVNVSLMLAPKSGYLFEWNGCMGLYDRNYGPVDFSNGRLRLTFTLPNSRERFRGIAGEFIPVAWGSREYLIPPDKVIDFCDDVKRGVEPRRGRHGQHLLRRGDETKLTTGSPTLPVEYEKRSD
jgi:hypothetical protein